MPNFYMALKRKYGHPSGITRREMLQRSLAAGAALLISERAGGAWKARFFGDAGNDTLIGTLKDDLLNGGPGRDSLDGKGGLDELR